MKKLFALAIVAGMVFVGCNQPATDAPEAEVEGVEAEAVIDDEQEAVEMPTEEVTEEVAE